MAEIVYQYSGKPQRKSVADIRWLSREELSVFNQHLTLCGQKTLSQEDWEEVCGEGTVYCLLFENGLPIARACVEKYSELLWEVADVRVVKEYRNRGFASEISRLVRDAILNSGRIPTIRTEEDNLPMRRVIEKLGFLPKNKD